MKKTIFGMFLGIVVTLSVVGVYALTASEIEYKNDKSVEDAIDALYGSVKPEYTGSTTVTPSTTAQTLSTENKVLTSDITVSAIPSNYKDLTSASDFSASDLLSGKKAYNNLGELITGTASITGEGTYWKKGTVSTVLSANGTITVGFRPSHVFVFGYNAGNYMELHASNSGVHEFIYYASVTNGNNSRHYDASAWIELTDTGFNYMDWVLGQSYDYIAIK